MTIDLCYSEISGMAAMSPRISFSQDLSQTETVPVEHLNRSNSSSSFDFDFSVVCCESSEQESSFAEELFSNGKILPTQIKNKKKNKNVQQLPPAPHPEYPPLQPPKRPQNAHEIIHCNNRRSSESEEKQNLRTCWRFKRSSSFNFGSGYARTLCPLPLLSRSNSTGSSKDGNKSKQTTNMQKSSSSSSFSLSSMRQTQSPSSAAAQKSPWKKNYVSYGNGAAVNPVVLNVPTAILFGLGSIFSGGKDKNKKIYIDKAF